MKKPAIVIIVLFLSIGVLVGIRSVAAARITTSGLELGKIQDVTIAYKTENVILKEKIFALSSLTHVSEAASKKGFVESKGAFAISKARPLARGQ